MDNAVKGSPGLLLMVAGSKGAIGTTLAVAAASLERHPEWIHPYLTTVNRFQLWQKDQSVFVCGWDNSPMTLQASIQRHGVVPQSLAADVSPHLDHVCRLCSAPADSGMIDQVRRIARDIDTFRKSFSGARPILVNLLPAGPQLDDVNLRELSDLERVDPLRYPDLAYTWAAIERGVPVVNFTPNAVNCDALIRLAEANGVPLSGRDGKTGQTYFKMVLASALKARSLYVDGWYSANILGNADGENLMDPQRAATKLSHKTEILDTLLGYQVGERHGTSTHHVRIDYYAPRGDAKEAWDVIDLLGLFDLPMSIRVDFQARDSVLAAPMVLDLAQWMVAAQTIKRSGCIAELGFYFKKPEGTQPPVTFENQVKALDQLAQQCCHSD